MRVYRTEPFVITVYTHIHTHNGPEMGLKKRKAPSFLPSKSDLRSLPKRMNTWPKKNLMAMTSDVRMLLRLRPNRRFAALVVLVTSTYVFFVRIGRNFCLMASLPYGCFDWILLRLMTLEMHSECIRLRSFILHSEYGKMPAHDFLIGRNQPTV